MLDSLGQYSRICVSFVSFVEIWIFQIRCFWFACPTFSPSVSGSVGLWLVWFWSRLGLFLLWSWPWPSLNSSKSWCCLCLNTLLRWSWLQQCWTESKSNIQWFGPPHCAASRRHFTLVNRDSLELGLLAGQKTYLTESFSTYYRFLFPIYHQSNFFVALPMRCSQH